MNVPLPLDSLLERDVWVPSTGWTERLTEEQFAYLLITPAFFLVGGLAIVPLLQTFQFSLHADMLRQSGYVGDFVGLTNYRELLTGTRNAVLGTPLLDLNAPLNSALTITLLYALVSVSIETVLGLGQALLLNEEFAGRRWVRAAILIPWAVPVAIQGMIFYLLFLPQVGFGTQVMQQLGMFSNTPLINTVDSLVIVIIADVWKTSAFMALLILAGLQTIDRELYDVAEVSGATRWQRFKTITFPLALPSILVAMLFRTIHSLQVFGSIETIAGCSTVPSLTCLVVSTYQTGRYGTTAALAFITAAIIGCIVLIYAWRFDALDRGAV